MSLRCLKEERVLLPPLERNRDIQIERCVKDELASPTDSSYTVFCCRDSSLPRQTCRNKAIKEKLTPVLMKMCGRLRRYLGGGSLSPRAIVSAKDPKRWCRRSGATRCVGRVTHLGPHEGLDPRAAGNHGREVRLATAPPR